MAVSQAALRYAMGIKMDKKEFLGILRNSLSSELPEDEIVNNINYYSDYISLCHSDNKTESEKLEELGDPRLIAKTIIDTFKMSHIPMQGYYNKQRNFNNGDKFYRDFEQENMSNNKEWKVKLFSGRMHWIQSVLEIFIFMVLFLFIITIGGIAINLFIRFGIIILFIYFFGKLLFKISNKK